MAWFLVYLLVGAVGAGLVRRYAVARALFDQPGERRSHTVPTPRGGGVAIAVALLLAAAMLAVRNPDQAPVLAGFGIGLALVTLVGWIDDHRSLSAWVRLVVHVLAGGVFALGAWWQSGDPAVAAVALAATVVLVNVWNFMDGIDGLAASQAILVAAVPALLAGPAGLALGLALVAATLGFLPWNFPRARLFLGDSGSGALGFAIGALVAMAMAAQGGRGLALALLPLSACLVDAGLTLARRVLRRERWWEPHVGHAYQHAARRHGHARVTLGFAAWTGLAATVAWLIRDTTFTSLIISLAPWYAFGAAAWWLLQRSWSIAGSGEQGMSSWRDRWTSGLPRWAVVTHDLAMVWLCWQGLHQFRHALIPDARPLPFWTVDTLIVLLAQGVVLWQAGLYRGLWRFASVPDLWNIAKACAIGWVMIVLGLFLTNALKPEMRVVLILYPFVLVGLLGTPRLLYRAWKDAQRKYDVGTAVRVLIVGAGQAGEALVRDMHRVGAYHPVGFLDDAARLRGSKVQGIPVLGKVADVAEIARETAARLLVIAMPSVDATALQRVVEACERSGVPFRMVPRLRDVLEGRSLPGELKKVAIEDLLGRKPVLPDWKAIREWLGGRSVLVTGAGGSIGAELCRQCARHGARRIALVEIDELALTTTEAELRRDFPDIECVPVLGDCGDPAVIAYALGKASPEAVFHAAAYKQVPLLETQLREAVRNNVLATETVARACREASIGTFVLISTDKAVDPVNVLGATKRLAEMACQSLADRRSTRFVTVRFGNVLDSAGSVVPLFREQIRAGGPVTVTDPEVTRYFMTIPEACQLILQASAIGSHEAIYTLDMGEPVPIRLLAEQMIRLAGKQPGRDIAITYTGLRPGEKLHETLFHAEESYRPTAHPQILQADPRGISAESIGTALVEMRAASVRYDPETLATLLQAAVPDFAPTGRHDDAPGGTVVAFPARHARKV